MEKTYCGHKRNKYSPLVISGLLFKSAFVELISRHRWPHLSSSDQRLKHDDFPIWLLNRPPQKVIPQKTDGK
jgi:hypothetical protein